jgi:hypothetical protein
MSRHMAIREIGRYRRDITRRPDQRTRTGAETLAQPASSAASAMFMISARYSGLTQYPTPLLIFAALQSL